MTKVGDIHIPTTSREVTDVVTSLQKRTQRIGKVEPNNVCITNLFRSFHVYNAY